MKADNGLQGLLDGQRRKMDMVQNSIPDNRENKNQLKICFTLAMMMELIQF
jgi:hypothetical protein